MSSEDLPQRPQFNVADVHLGAVIVCALLACVHVGNKKDIGSDGRMSLLALTTLQTAELWNTAVQQDA